MTPTGIITKVSNQDFDSRYKKLRSIIENNPNLKIIAELDHQANAASKDLRLNPTRIIMFGNPNLGTPLMQTAQTIGLDLPQKILVYQNESGEVLVSYNDPIYLRNRHSVIGKEEILAKITGALDKITTGATT